MTVNPLPLDIEAIRGRYEVADQSQRPNVPWYVLDCVRDVPALIAEVEALRAQLASSDDAGYARAVANLRGDQAYMAWVRAGQRDGTQPRRSGWSTSDVICAADYPDAAPPDNRRQDDAEPATKIQQDCWCGRLHRRCSGCDEAMGHGEHHNHRAETTDD